MVLKALLSQNALFLRSNFWERCFCYFLAEKNSKDLYFFGEKFFSKSHANLQKFWTTPRGVANLSLVTAANVGVKNRSEQLCNER